MGRPYQRCTRTIMDTTDADIRFDEHGVSSHALAYDAIWAADIGRAQRGERRDELDAMVARIRKAGEGRPYDCVMGVSGGVDSTYAVLQAVRLGLRPLLVHFDSGWNSELAVGNIHELVTTLGLDLYTHVIDWREMKDLQLSFVKASLANLDVPTDHAFGWVAYTQAVKYGIRYIVSGGNAATESVLPESWGYNPDDARQLKAVHRRFGRTKLRTYPVMGMFARHIWYPRIRRIATVRLLDHLPYVYTEAKEDIARSVGWRDYGGKHFESVFTRYFQGHYLPHKFGFDKRLAHYSSLILSGQLTRDAALARMDEVAYPEQLRRQDHEFIAKKLGLTPEGFQELIDLPPVDYTAYPNSERAWAFVLKAGAPFGRLARRLGRGG